MTLDEYQELAAVTKGKDDVVGLATSGLGIAGEAGEVADIIKKEVGHGHPAEPERIKKEVGDVLWYAADIARRYGFRLSEVATANIEKLRARYPEGFSSERSINRSAE